MYKWFIGRFQYLSPESSNRNYVNTHSKPPFCNNKLCNERITSLFRCVCGLIYSLFFFFRCRCCFPVKTTRRRTGLNRIDPTFGRVTRSSQYEIRRRTTADSLVGFVVDTFTMFPSGTFKYR